MSIESVMPSSHLILCRPLLLLPPIPPSIRVFPNESTLRMRWPKYWSFSFSISPSNEHSGLISFRMDCLDLLAVQGTLKSLVKVFSELCYNHLTGRKVRDLDISLSDKYPHLADPHFTETANCQPQLKLIRTRDIGSFRCIPEPLKCSRMGM